MLEHHEFFLPAVLIVCRLVARDGPCDVEPEKHITQVYYNANIIRNVLISYIEDLVNASYMKPLASLINFLCNDRGRKILFIV